VGKSGKSAGNETMSFRVPAKRNTVTPRCNEARFDQGVGYYFRQLLLSTAVLQSNSQYFRVIRNNSE
jgi:hypothetical protein